MKTTERDQATGDSATGMIWYWLDCTQEKEKLENFTKHRIYFKNDQMRIL